MPPQIKSAHPVAHGHNLKIVPPAAIVGGRNILLPKALKGVTEATSAWLAVALSPKWFSFLEVLGRTLVKPAARTPSAQPRGICSTGQEKVLTVPSKKA